jgi:hypothetical protein
MAGRYIHKRSPNRVAIARVVLNQYPLRFFHIPSGKWKIQHLRNAYFIVSGENFTEET